MIVYHGTTHRRAQRICEVGFLPKKPSKRVWFARSKGYAERRARQQAHRARDRAVVLTCDVNLNEMRERLGRRKVMYKGGIISINGPVPGSALRSHTMWPGVPKSPEELARWVNNLLRLKSHKGVSPKHAGIERLSRWVMNRITSQPHSRLKDADLLHMARRWLAEYFEGVEVDPESLHTYRHTRQVDIPEKYETPERDARDDEIAELLADTRPKRRIRGLAMLAETGDADLFDWCAMFANDRSVNVRIAALHAMLHCQDGDAELIAPLAESPNKRLRGAAIAALAKLGEGDSYRWFARGLKDPEPCVRLETARALPWLDPTEHRTVFELALYDPNPDVVRMAEKLTAGKGFGRAT